MNFDKLNKITAGKVKTTGISAFSELEISKVYPNQDQPRKQFDNIEELASTIKEHGLLQPITVIKKDDRYMIISGERRYRAHLHNDAKTIKAHIVNVTDEAVEELTLIENIQRNDLTDFETAKHICKLWDSGRYEKKSDLATKIGKSDSYVSKAFSCLKLDSEILEDIEVNKKNISVSVMDEISRVKNPTVQKEVYEKYNNGEITRDEIKEFKPKKTIKEKVEEFKNPPISCNYVEENSPREKSFLAQLDDANKLENQLTQLIQDGYRDYHPKIKLNNHYERLIYRLLLEKDSEYIKHKVNTINTCIVENGYTKPGGGSTYLFSDSGGVCLDNRYDEIIFDLLKENLELKKEIEELKQNQPPPKEKAPIKDDEQKEIKLLELNENDVYVEYMDNESEHISYNKAKSLIKNSKKEYIKYENTGNEKACNFLNTLPRDILQTGGYLKKQYKF